MQAWMKDGGKEGEIKELMNEWILFGLNGWKYQLMDNKCKKTCEKAPMLQNSVPKQVPSVENSKK